MWIEERELAPKLFTEDGAKFKHLPQANQTGKLQAARRFVNQIMRMPGSSGHPATSFKPLVIKNGRVVESEGPNWQCVNMVKVSG